MSESSYTPIACSVYDVLEASAVKRTNVILELANGEHTASHTVRILDVFSRDGAEFLRAREVHSNEEFTVRLDTLATVTDIATGMRYQPRACTT